MYEDREGKMGWITTGPEGSTIEFDLAFGKEPRLTLAYLFGYHESLGEVLLSMRNRSAVPWSNLHIMRRNVAGISARGLESEREVHSTQIRTMAFKVSDAGMSNYIADRRRYNKEEAGPHSGWAVPPWSNATLSIRLRGCKPSAEACKFKVVSVTSC